MPSFEDTLQQLPPNLKQEAFDFIQFLLSKQNKTREKKLNLGWAGGLKEYKDKFTSVELQKKAIEWWGK